MNTVKIGLVFWTLLALLILEGSVLAQGGGPPHRFRGTFTLNGNPAPDGIIIEARINGLAVAASSSIGGNYGTTPANRLDIPDPNNNREGMAITFYALNTNVGERVFHNGNSDVFNIILIADYCGDSQCTGAETTSTCPADCPAAPADGGSGGGGSGGGGSGGGGGALTSFSTTPVEETCVPDWTCSEWLDCTNGVQKRVCVDSSKCGMDETKPAVQAYCESEETIDTTEDNFPLNDNPVELTAQEAAKEEGMGGITGAVLGGGTGSIIALIVLIAIVGAILAIYFLNKRRR
ncbi:MAG: hypothetical protein ABIJ21_04690 [Nanoarchaeota archaeon]